MFRSSLTRRGLFGLGLIAGGGLVLPRLSLAESDPLPLTPACVDGDDPTPAQTAGPFFTPNSPERSDFVVDGVEGNRISLVGFALDQRCQPIPGALVDLWHANDAGQYDNQGYRLRGHLFTDAQGRFAFATIVPGLYPGRTRHFHVKVQPPGGRILTTQLYLPGEGGNDRDWIFDSALLLGVTSADAGQIGRFDFVLATAGS